MKVLWHSNAPWAPTGYGNQTGLFTPRLNASGHDVVVSAFYGLEGAMLGWKGVPVLPGMGGTFGNESLPGHAKGFFGEPRGGVVMTLMDVWVLDPAMIGTMNVASWVPVDHEPLPPAVERYFRDSGAIPIAMSHFGEQQLSEYDPLYVPHAVDTKAFAPADHDESRQAAGTSDSQFVVGMVAANKGNPSRKAFPQTLMAFKAFRERHDDAVLCLHTEMQAGNGLNLHEMITEMGLEDDVVIADQYSYVYHPRPPAEMAQMYSSFDVLVNCSMGGGFELPVLEAQACGTPAIVTDFSAMKEVCGAGWRVDYTKTFTGQLSWQAEPVIEDIVESLEAAYRMPDARRQLVAEQARNHALRYDVDTVLDDYMLPALTEIDARFGVAAGERAEAKAKDNHKPTEKQAAAK